MTAELLARVRARYCRVMTRGDLQKKSQTPGGMAGVLVRTIYDWLETHFRKFPGLTDLGKACEPSVKLNVLNKFFGGNATQGTHWFQNARDMLRFLLAGENPDESSEKYRIYLTIEQYFFQNVDPDDPNRPTPFFREERTAEAWNRTEVGGELLLVLNKRIRHPDWPAEAVWVSGGGALFPEGIDKVAAQATATAITGGLPVTFVTFPTSADGGVSRNLTDFFEAHPGAKEGTYSEIDLSKPDYQAVPGWFGFAGACVQYLYLTIRNPADLDNPHENLKALYFLRGLRIDDPGETLGQAAFTGNAAEIRLFETWLKSIRSAKANAAQAATAAAEKSR